MLATCINADITWSDGRLTLSVNTALFKLLTDTLQPVLFTQSDCRVKGTAHIICYYFTEAPRATKVVQKVLYKTVLSTK